MAAVVTPFSFFDESVLSSLIQEFRTTMRCLLVDLCDELDGPYRHASRSLRIPTGFMRAVEVSLNSGDFSNWKVVGWIEELNDLVYLLDVREQIRREADPRGFAEAFYSSCASQFYEHGYLDELFPEGRPQAAALARRLSGLCEKLARQVTRESLFLVPGLPCRWMEETAQRAWSVPFDFGPHFERAELPDCVPYGLNGGALFPAAAVQRRLPRAGLPADLLIRPDGIEVRVGTYHVPLLILDASPQWQWRADPTTHVASCIEGPGKLTLGPTLVYGKDRAPVRVVSSSLALTERLTRAISVIRAAWPEGARNLALLTTRVSPLQARGVVSFSYRHRPGLSFINCFDRDQFDLIDDLIHENSHHQLNLYLRKARLIQGDRHEEIFYSPWRRTARPLRGILHATFTFTMGAMLFERLSHSEMLTAADRLRARARCVEEVASVQYSLSDLEYAGRRLRWLTASGMALVTSLKREITRVHRRIVADEAVVLRSPYGASLSRHQGVLRQARQTYGPHV
jgi:hypothetical protein